jgi:murein DD-endopeptidase MepM/ murein hydrolase activator NlpD
VKTTRLALGWLVVAAPAVLIALVPRAAEASAALTLPFNELSIPVNSWFDHTFPLQSGDTNQTMTRHDGTTGWSYNGHNGIDFGLPSSSTTVAAAPGVVQFIGWQDPNDHSAGFGFYVRVWHSGLNYSTLYGHLSQNYVVAVGQSLSRGQLLGYSDSTGQSTGPHLHFGVYNSQSGWTPMDPYGWSGGGSDPWSYDIGYLWSTTPPISRADIAAMNGYSNGVTRIHTWLEDGGEFQGYNTWYYTGGPYYVANVGDRFVLGDFDGR